MRTALSEGLDVFRTTHLFAPFGADLTLHTYGPLTSYLGATILGGLSTSAALNVTILASVALNGWCTYLLAWRLTGDRIAAVVAGLVFGGSPYVAVRLAGHFNLLAAWPLPLAVLAVLEARRGSTRWAAVGGVVVGLTMYVDYYYVVYAIVLAAGLLLAHWFDWSLMRRDPTPISRRIARLVGGLVLADLALIAAVLMSGGGAFDVGPIHLSVSGVFNPLQFLWLLVTTWIWLRTRPNVGLARRVDARAAVRVVLTAVAAGAVIAAPIVWRAIALVLRGDYTTQPAYWRSGPRGVDLATLAFGPPAHGVLGLWSGRAYDALEIHAIESVGWLGVIPVVLAGLAFVRRRRLPVSLADATRLWIATGLCFLVFALGSHLMIAGANTGMVLPQAFLHFVPILNNARMPGRAIVVTHLALAVLAAIAVSQWRPRPMARALGFGAVVLAIGLESLPAPVPLVALDPPALVTTLRDRPEAGAVLDLPLGVRDGFGGPGVLDHGALFHQTVHGRPMIGGFLARVPRSLVEAHRSDPLLAALLDLSEPETGDHRTRTQLPDRAMAGRRLRALGVAFVLIDRRTATPALANYVTATLPITEVGRDAYRTLYLVSR
jgi:hypothetical protein